MQQALRNLETHTGIKGEWKPLRHTFDKGMDGELTLDINGEKFVLDTEVKREVRQYQWNHILELANRHEPFLLVANHIYPAIKEKLRGKGIAYLDAAGNLFLRQGDKWIWIEGNKVTREEKPIPNRAFTKAGLKVIHVLLIEQDAIRLPYREIAVRAGVALGNMTMVLAGLREGGYLLQLDKKTVTLQNKKELLERWIAGYGEVLKPALHMGNYRFADDRVDWRNLVLAHGDVWGAEPAAYNITKYLDPEALTVYTAETIGRLMKNWKLIPDPNGQVQVFQKFWMDNDGEPCHHAPYLLVYADLMLTNDPRCIETAEMIFNEHLKPFFD